MTWSEQGRQQLLKGCRSRFEVAARPGQSYAEVTRSPGYLPVAGHFGGSLQSDNCRQWPRGAEIAGEGRVSIPSQVQMVNLRMGGSSWQVAGSFELGRISSGLMLRTMPECCAAVTTATTTVSLLCSCHTFKGDPHVESASTQVATMSRRMHEKYTFMTECKQTLPAHKTANWRKAAHN